MAQRSLARRVEILEEKVASLEELPERAARIESQILQFRDEVRGEFSAIRAETIARLEASEGETRRLLQVLRDDLVARLEASESETRRYRRVLHEEVIQRIAVIGEARSRPRKRR